MRAAVISFALVLPISLVANLGAARGASDAPAPTPAPVPAAAGQPVFVPIDRTHVLLALPPRAAPNDTQAGGRAGSFVAPSGAGANGVMPFYAPPGTTQ